MADISLTERASDLSSWVKDNLVSLFSLWAPVALWELQLNKLPLSFSPKVKKQNKTNKQAKHPTESWGPKTSPIMVSLPEKQQPRKGLQKHMDGNGWKAPQQQDSKAAEEDGCGRARKPRADKNTQDSARTLRTNVSAPSPGTIRRPAPGHRNRPLVLT